MPIIRLQSTRVDLLRRDREEKYHGRIKRIIFKWNSIIREDRIFASRIFLIRE